MIPPLRLTLREAIELTANTNAKLAGHVNTRSAADARRRQAALRPPVELNTEIENIFGTRSLGTFSDMEATLSLGTVIELGDKRTSRMTLADREKQALQARQDMERLDILAEVAHQFVSVLHIQAELSMARENRALAAEVAKIAEQRAAAAVSTAVDKRNADVGMVRAELDEVSAESRLKAAWAALVVHWGGSPESSGEAAGNLLDLPDISSFSDIMARLDASPDLAVLAAEKASRTAALASSQSGAAPNIAVSAGVRRLQAAREQAFVLSASVPIGTASRSKPFADEAREDLAAIEYDIRAHRELLAGDLFGILQSLENSRRAVDLLVRKAIPAAQAARHEADTLFRSGRSSLLELTAAQRQLLELRHEAIDAAHAYHDAIIDIERLTGMPITTTALLPTSQTSTP
ncbi:MAG: TolC family protein [Rhodobacteraceae bacterium]|nr:TolC family protein [Paracoccaceae bacterium]